jgi:serine/threonine-protein kinase
MDLREQLQSTLGHAYRLDRELSGGAMSRVFFARDAALGRDVVIKVVSPELAGSLSTERFRREIELSARLQHPNIVPLLTAGDADGLSFYTMPLVAGESLRARLARDGALPIRQALSLLRDVARALAYAHRHGVVHRDVKPDNILITSDYAVVTDFGIAKAIAAAARDARDDTAALTALGVSLGTPAYMAPEQIAADPDVDARADIYAFGALAYETLTGALPFGGRNAQAILAAHMTAAAQPIAARRDGIPPPIAALVMRCLEKQPDARPQSTDEIIAALTAVLESDGASRGTRRTRTRWIAASTVVAVIAIAGVLTIRARRADSSKSLNRRLIAVVPFRVTATDSSVRSLREGMLDLITAKLTGATRTVDSRTLLGAWRRRGGTANADLSEAKAVDLAKELGAGRVLQGEIVQTGDTLTVTGSLIDATAPQKPATTSVRGSSSAIAALVDTMVGKLLVLGAGERRPEALASIPLPALQAYLEGQDAYRAGRYQIASEAFARALEIDSTFALAGVRLSLAAEWSFDRRAPAGRAVAFRYRDRLSERDQLILGPPTGPRSAADLYAYAEQAVQTAPDVPELWHRVADLLFHFGDAMGVPDAWRRSAAGFERALKLDSAFTPSREHLPSLYASLGDTAAALRMLERPDSSGLPTVLRFLIAPDPKQRLAAMRALQRRPLGEMRVGDVIASGGDYVDYSDSLLTAAESRVVTSADRAALARVTRDVALTRGQPKRAAAALRETKAPIGTQVLDALLGDGDSVAAAAVIPSLESAVHTAPTDAERDAWLTNAFALSQHAVASGALTEAKALSGEIQRLTPDTTRTARRVAPRAGKQ